LIKIRRSGEELRDEGMARADAHVEPGWKHMAVRAFIKVSYGKDEFTTDDVWEQLDEWEVDPPHEPRAMGPLVTQLLREGVIEHTGKRAVKSRIPRGHARKVEVYRRAND